MVGDVHELEHEHEAGVEAGVEAEVEETIHDTMEDHKMDNPHVELFATQKEIKFIVVVNVIYPMILIQGSDPLGNVCKKVCWSEKCN